MTIVLPETTDCSHDSAVCTASDKMLTVGDSATVSGPEEQDDQQDGQQQQEQGDPPGAPTNLSGVIDADGNIALTWTDPGDDSVTGYLILRRRPQQGETGLQIYIADTGSTDTFYTDADTSLATRYVYRVKAINAAGVGHWSNFWKIDKP